MSSESSTLVLSVDTPAEDRAAPPLALPVDGSLLVGNTGVEIERDTVEDEDALLGGLEIVPPLTFWTENKQASFAVNNRLLKCKYHYSFA